jgi:hypothetical protein
MSSAQASSALVTTLALLVACSPAVPVDPDASVLDAPALDVPASADAPGRDVSTRDASSDAPVVPGPDAPDASALDAPAIDAPALDATAIDAPALDAPAPDTPAFDAPAAPAPLVEVYPVVAGHGSSLWRVEAWIDDAWVDAGALEYRRMSEDPNYHGLGYRYDDRSGPTGGGSPGVHWVTVGVESTVRLRLRRLPAASPIRSVRVLPASYGIEARLDATATEVELELRQGQTVYVETDEQDFETLFLFANPPRPPVPAGPGVVYFGPGVHELGRDYHPPAGTHTLYIDGGAWVSGSIDVSVSGGPVFRLLGPGVLSGDFDTHEACLYVDGDPAQPRPYEELVDWSLVHTNAGDTVAHDVEVIGLTLVASPFYNFHLSGAQRKRFAHVHLLSPWTYNTDGFNAGTDVTVEDSFVFNNDDTIHAEYTYRGPVEVRRSVFGGRNAFLVGYGYFTGNRPARALAEGVELILQRNRIPFRAEVDARPPRTPGVLDPSTDVVIEGETFRDIRIDGRTDMLVRLVVEHTPWGFEGVGTGPAYGNLRDIAFEHLEVLARPARRSVIRGAGPSDTVGSPEAPIVFLDLRIAGVLVTEANAAEYFDIGPYAHVAFR